MHLALTSHLLIFKYTKMARDAFCSIEIDNAKHIHEHTAVDGNADSPFLMFVYAISNLCVLR